MTTAQNNLYWGKWSRVKAALVKFGGCTAAQAEEKRHEIHVEALGRDKSSKEFTNRDLDGVLDAFNEYLIGKAPENRALAMPLKRAITGIEKVGLPDAYIAKIAADKFQGCTDWRSLTERQLLQLKMTLDQRRKQATHA